MGAKAESASTVTSNGATDRESDPSTVGVGKDRAAGVAGAVRPEPKRARAILEDALQILTAGRQMSLPSAQGDGENIENDLDVVSAIEAIVFRALGELRKEETEQLAARRNLERARAELRRLDAALAAPRPTSTVKTVAIDEEENDVDAFYVTLSDGSLYCYWPCNAPGDRWEKLEPVPTTRAAILQGDDL